MEMQKRVLRQLTALKKLAVMKLLIQLQAKILNQLARQWLIKTMLDTMTVAAICTT